MNTILITGASSGIGRETARHFWEKGWNVIATMRSPEHETEFTGQERMLVTKLDVTRNDTIQSAAQEGIRAFSKIDVLLNNAGYAAIGAFEAATEAQIKRQFDVNLLGVLRTTQALLPHFRQSGGGTVINVSSVGGRVAFPLLSLYHASKWAIEGFSESLFYEMAAHQIKVKLVEPGNVATDFTGRSLDLLTDTSLDAYASYTETVLQKQMNSFDVHASEPKLIAETIFEAATDPSDRLRYLVGADAHYLMDLRSKTSDEEFMAGITKQFS